MQRTKTGRYGQRAGDRRGAMAILIAVCLPVFLAFAAFAVNVAYMHLSRAELRVATDAAARAGARRLSLSQDTSAALAEAQSAASRNLVWGEPLQLEHSDVEFGLNQRSGGTWVFTPNGGQGAVNALRVRGRKTDDSPSHSVALFLPRVLGQDDYEPIQKAVAMQIDRDIVLVVDRSGSMASPVDTNDPGYLAYLQAVQDLEVQYCAGQMNNTQYINAYYACRRTT